MQPISRQSPVGHCRNFSEFPAAVKTYPEVHPDRVICIPTTSGTEPEATRYCNIVDPAQKIPSSNTVRSRDFVMRAHGWVRNGICSTNLTKCDRGFGDDCAPAGGWRGWAPLQWDAQVLEKLLPEITTCHLHDNIGQYDQHRVPGCGNIDWLHVVGLLKIAPRLKCIQCKTISVRTGSSSVDLCRAMQRLFA